MKNRFNDDNSDGEKKIMYKEDPWIGEVGGVRFKCSSVEAAAWALRN